MAAIRSSVAALSAPAAPPDQTHRPRRSKPVYFSSVLDRLPSALRSSSFPIFREPFLCCFSLLLGSRG